MTQQKTNVCMFVCCVCCVCCVCVRVRMRVRVSVSVCVVLKSNCNIFSRISITESVWIEPFKWTNVKAKLKLKMLGQLLLTFGTGLVAYAFYKISTNNAKYFEERNLKYRGVLGLLKGLIFVSLGRYDILTMIKRMYDAFPDVA